MIDIYTKVRWILLEEMGQERIMRGEDPDTLLNAMTNAELLKKIAEAENMGEL